MRLRTGHNPDDWTEVGPGAARLSGHSGASIHGELVRGGESDADRQRRHQREHMRRRRARPVDLNDYIHANKWEGKERCGVMMTQAKLPCNRLAGHKREHKSAEAMEYGRTRRRSSAA